MKLQIDPVLKTWNCLTNARLIQVSFHNETAATYTLLCRVTNRLTDQDQCKLCLHYHENIFQQIKTVQTDKNIVPECAHQQKREAFVAVCKCSKTVCYCDIYLKQLTKCMCSKECPYYSRKETACES